MTLEQTTCEDLKAFERRLVEVIAYYQPQTKRWRVMFGVVSLCTAIGAWQWLTDPLTTQVPFIQSLVNHLFFTISSAVLLSLFIMGVHQRVVAPSIIVSRVRQVLADFNMSCDDHYILEMCRLLIKNVSQKKDPRILPHNFEPLSDNKENT